MAELVIGGRNGRIHKLVDSPDLVAVRTVSRTRLDRSDLSLGRIRDAAKTFSFIQRFRSAGLDVYRVDSNAHEVQAMLEKVPGIRTAGRVLVDPKSSEPFVYRERVYLSLKETLSETEAQSFLSRFGKSWILERQLPYVRHSYLLVPRHHLGQGIFNAAVSLLEHREVDRCHPEFLRTRGMRTQFPAQWHLGSRTIGNVLIEEHANVEAAWALSRGDSTIIAVIDDGVDMGHPEFSRKGKVIADYDFTNRVPDASPKEPTDAHGTACAGVACADGIDGACGVAPGATLMPIRLMSELGSIDESDAFQWAIDRGADVISCSWGPEDGRGVEQPMPDNIQQVIDQAIRRGRGGKGCAIVFAAGNGDESADLDGYARYPDIIAVAACNDRGRRSNYSDTGKCVACCFPSGDGRSANPLPRTTGIWTTDRSGKDGYNSDGGLGGDTAGNYVNAFSGTSSSCPGVAGVIALMLAANQSLTAKEVRQVLTSTSDQIDKTNGSYGADGHSTWYGFGRVNAERAVQEAIKKRIAV